ncbi:hypothetical protein [Streptomyces sp. YIM 98790]|uniref:hypothetical protein n=1 Tax=Streptomyces sp. YIM 98790 TaxID=2689077 RepID=UPI00140C0B91|nr:hypothetical protein [Streptomyces sp. YIM 98790]
MQSNDARILRGAALVTAVAGVLAVAVGALAGGGRAALGIALGVLVAGAFFASGQAALARIAARRPEVFLSAALFVYVSQVGVLMVMVLLLRDASFLDGKAFGTGVLVGLAAWLGGQIRANLKAKTAYVVPETAPVTPAAGPAPAGQAGERP